MLTFDDVRNNPAIRIYIERANESLRALGFTEHSFPHVLKVADTASYLGYIKGENPDGTTADASVPVENTLMYAAALRRAGVSMEMHIFDKGPHAMGLATAESAWQADHTSRRAARWFPLCVSWLKGLK